MINIVNVSTTIGWIFMKLCADIHVPRRMNPADFCDPLTFPLAQVHIYGFE